MAQTRRHAEVLAQAKARERAAGKKVSKNEAKGTQLAGSRHDPRVGAKALEQMSTQALQSHLRQVNRFLSPKTQFVHNYSGLPIRADRWKKYQDLEAKNNALGQSVVDKFGADELLGQNGTVEGRLGRRNELIAKKNGQRQRERANNQGRVWEPIVRDIRYVESEGGLEKLIAQMQKRTQVDYLSKTTKARLNSGRAILKYSGNGDLIPLLDNLTLEQRMLLADVSEFFDVALENFNSPDKSEVDEVKDADYEERQGIGTSNTHLREALMDELNWVKKIAPRGGKTGAYVNPESAKPRKSQGRDKQGRFTTGRLDTGQGRDSRGRFTGK